MIVHVITNFTARSGAEVMLCRLLRVAGPERVVVAPVMEVSDDLRGLAGNPAVVFRPQHGRSVFGMVRAVFGLARLIRAEKPDAVVCWMYHAMVVGGLATRLAGLGTPLVWNVRQSLDDRGSLTVSTRAAVWLTRLLSRLPDGIIFNARRAEEQHRTYGYAARRSAVIPNGFDLPELRERPAAPARVFGIAGRFHPQKDHETFFRAAGLAFARNPDLRFAAAGAGMDWSNPEVAALVDAAGLPRDRVDLAGPVTDMAAWYRRIDALVLSSRTEGFPNVVAEAMSHGRPVVATDVGDAAAIVGGTGFVVAPRDPAALAGALVEMAALSPAAYADRAAAARRRIEDEYALPAIARRYDEFLRQCRAGRAPAPLATLSEGNGKP
ncbi:glycosyltransferase [Prosthecomicrobium sp. N25]|uniref:glycosyltransferase n=1 Tax=Prosthecomicrobium sp. N25 TaxID=3129254 RepID=UPI0030788CB3